MESVQAVKRIMVDMSMTLMHHGHIRLLRRAWETGHHVVVALTTDKEILSYKGYTPELSYDQRKEVLEGIKYVHEVVPSPWLIDEAFMDKHQCDYLVHGHDNFNHVRAERLVLFPRTEGISSSDIRRRVLDCLIAVNLKNKTDSRSDKLARALIDVMKSEFNLK
ncbi:MAG: adenylyltransferase/cytidyltransferase family protein [Planctomycetota bacterium]|jgi:glycerol-3-phosphate cytidylyltransferase|nr:adenylyltransferase/cytidyltransferase family protein [Planctomycetota bacterium]